MRSKSNFQVEECGAIQKLDKKTQVMKQENKLTYTW
jgi:hypothetical protein